MKTTKINLIAAALLALCISCKNSGSGASSSKLSVSPGSDTGITLPQGEGSALAEVDEDIPAIRFISKGSILPSSGNAELLFSSINYAKAEIRVKKVYQNNILQFLQFDTYEVQYEAYKVAKQVIDTTITLGTTDAPHIRENKVYGLSLDELIKPEPGAIYHIEIRGREPLMEEDFWDSDSYFGDYETYEQRSVNLLATDLALLAKGGDNGFEVFAFNILTGKPAAGISVKLYDFVQQELAKGTTDKDGRISFPGHPDGRFVTATDKKHYAYLDLREGKSLSTSNFDVASEGSGSDLKAYIFGERGVWRPGDTLHVSTILMDEDDMLPEGHPVIAELRNPDGQVTQTVTVRNTGNHLFHFPFVTQADAPTGRWRVGVTVGGQTFFKSLRIETVKPNKLNIDINFGRDIITPDTDCSGSVKVDWLYGAVGKDLKVNGDINVSSGRTAFADFKDYDFIDDSRDFDSFDLHYRDQFTDEEGRIYINSGMDINKSKAPGMLDALFTFRAFEPSGEFSTGSRSFKLSPFKAYVGIKDNIKLNSWGEKTVKAGTSQKFDVVTVDADGKPINVNNLHVEIYHVDYSWWWDSSSQIASYMAGSGKELFFETRISTSNGRAEFSYDWDDTPSGCYFIRVSDERGGHATSMLCEANSYGSDGKAEDSGSTKLNIALNKDTFNVGETAKLTIPSAKGTTAIVSLEKGGRCISIDRVECYAGSTDIQIPITKEMLPNVYAFVTLIQPHKQTENDAPIRLYGVRNINVEDASSHLQPTIDIAQEVKPETTVNFKVKEENGRAMSYVVALVDEGLLGLTGFKTPNAWDSFYAKQALRVRTWDVYDDIIGAYGGHIEQLFAIGGDDEAAGVLKPQNAQRFTPVVAYLGPFDLKAGKTASHSIDIPSYIGSLRAMVIATDGKAQGSCQKNVNVTKPVMVQATLPRTLSVGETIKVPVTVITMKDNVGSVKVGIKAQDKLEVVGSDTKTINPKESGQYVEYFDVKVADVPGIGRLTATAEGAGDKSTDRIEIDVFNPNPVVTRLKGVLLKGGETKDLKAEIFGISGSNELQVELSSIPSIDLGSRLKYLTEYPYGCIEQTISGAFPQIYIDKIVECDETVKAKCVKHVTAAIGRMQSFRLGNGAMSYWPGGKYVSSFGTVYALHFLQEAEANGYAVPSDLKGSIISYVSSNIVNDTKEGWYVRAYAAYALAAAGKPQRSAMNNLRSSSGKMPHNAVWMLAAAYACDGKKSVAQQLVTGLAYTENNSSYYYDYYGSEDRNMAIALKTNILLGQNEAAFKLASSLADKLNDSDHYMSTQSTSWALCSVFEYARNMAGEGINAKVDAGGRNYKLSTAKALVTQQIPVESTSDITLKISNSGSNTVYAVASSTGIPPAGEEKGYSKGILLAISYEDLNHNTIRPDTLSRGTSFIETVTVTNNSPKNISDIALARRFPSGWEINNDRIYNDNASYPAGLTYQDIRDDRVYSFFNLGTGNSVSVSTKLTATYPGKFYMPAIKCEAMYDADLTALYPGRWIEIE